MSGSYVTLYTHTHTTRKAEVAGKKGLVPSNFLEAMSSPKTDEIEVFAADVESMRIADAIIQQRVSGMRSM